MLGQLAKRYGQSRSTANGSASVFLLLGKLADRFACRLGLGGKRTGVFNRLLNEFLGHFSSWS